MKKLMIYLFTNSEKLVQIRLEFSQLVVESYEFMLAKFRSKRPFQSSKICDLSKKGLNLFGLILRLCTKCKRSIVCNLDVTAAHCGA